MVLISGSSLSDTQSLPADCAKCGEWKQNALVMKTTHSMKPGKQLFPFGLGEFPGSCLPIFCVVF